MPDKTNQAELCHCGHALLIHRDDKPHKCRVARCKCKSFHAKRPENRAYAALADILKPGSLAALVSLHQELRTPKPLLNLYGSRRALYFVKEEL